MQVPYDQGMCKEWSGIVSSDWRCLRYWCKIGNEIRGWQMYLLRTEFRAADLDDTTAVNRDWPPSNDFNEASQTQRVGVSR